MGHADKGAGWGVYSRGIVKWAHVRMWGRSAREHEGSVRVRRRAQGEHEGSTRECEGSTGLCTDWLLSILLDRFVFTLLLHMRIKC